MARHDSARAPDTGSKKKFDVNRQQKNMTGKFNYASTKKERTVIKAGRTDIVPEVSWSVCIGVVVLIAVTISFFVWFMAQLEEAEVSDKE
ncbi:hypothetical protein T484DRAFT_1887479 [Baffinella frigidus]|nr:hypothetical protein T484DRAFT_1887479 [Cryptophyta sp. CCMP2293]